MSDIRLRLLSANFEENFEHTHQSGEQSLWVSRTWLLRNWPKIRHKRMQHGVVQTTAADAIAVHEHNNRRILIREAMETRHETRDLATVAL